MTTLDPAITVRPAAPADDWAVQHLFNELHAFNAELDSRFALAAGWENVLREHLAHVRATGHGLTLLARKADIPVGLLMMGVHSDSHLFLHRHWAELLAVYVTPSARGTDLAEHLVALGATWAHESGYERVQLYVTASNERAKQFYARIGFRPVQEIWRQELGPTSVLPPDDPIWEAIYAHDHDLLSTNSHHLLVDDAAFDTERQQNMGSKEYSDPNEEQDNLEEKRGE